MNVVYGWGLRHREVGMLKVADFGVYPGVVDSGDGAWSTSDTARP